MSGKRLSVIIPIYNVENYIESTIQSALELKNEEGIELLLVNDASEDDSGRIAKRYAEKYPKFIRYYDVAHLGVSHARNFGIIHAKGEYIVFCDGDDCIVAKSVVQMLETAKQEKLDIVIAQIQEFDAFNEHVYAPTKRLSSCPRIEKDNVDLLWSFMISGKMYRRAFLIKSHVHFLPFAYSEDAVFQMTAVGRAESIGGCNVIASRYRKRMFYESQSVTQQYRENLWNDFWEAHAEVKKVVGKKIAAKLPDEKKTAYMSMVDLKISESIINTFYRSIWNCSEETEKQVVTHLQNCINGLNEKNLEKLRKNTTDLEIYPKVVGSDAYRAQPMVSLIIAEGLSKDAVLWSLKSIYAQKLTAFIVIVPDCYAKHLKGYEKKKNLVIVPKTGKAIDRKIVAEYCRDVYASEYFMYLDKAVGFHTSTLRQGVKEISSTHKNVLVCQFVTEGNQNGLTGKLEAVHHKFLRKLYSAGKLYKTEAFLNQAISEEKWSKKALLICRPVMKKF